MLAATLNSSEVSNNCSIFDSRTFSIVAAVSAFSGFTSLLANTFVFLFILLYKRWGFFNQRLVLYLTLATICSSIACIVSRAGYHNDAGGSYDKFCTFGGFFLQTSFWMVLDAYICITASLLLKLFFNIGQEKLDVAAILFVFVFPFLFNWIPFILGAYGKTGAWCWIRSIEENSCDQFLVGRILQIVLLYAPLYLVLGLLIALYSIVVFKFVRLKRNWVEMDLKSSIQRQQALRYSVSLLAYPVIYFVTSLFPLINRIYELVRPNQPSTVLWFLSGFLFFQQGVGITVVFFFNVDIRKELKLTSIKAALAEWLRKDRVEEYDLVSGVLEESVEYTKYK